MEFFMNDSRYATFGLIMTMAPPPARKPSLVVSARYTGGPANTEATFEILFDLKPLVTNGSQVPIQNISDSRQAIGVMGDFRPFGTIGLHRFDLDAFLKTVELWKELTKKCPDAVNTAYNFQWDSRPVKPPPFDSAMCHHDIRFWQYVHSPS